MSTMVARISGIISESFVDGPGIRYVIFMQGCLHNCYNCHNKNTHSLNGGYKIDLDEVIYEVNSNKNITGLTLSGGEPFLQVLESLYLLENIKLPNIVYTGYTYESLIQESKVNNNIAKILSKIDILIDGPYIDSKRDISLKYRGSTNQRIIDMQQSLACNNLVVIEI